jgi:hypothetical protein
MMDDRTLYFDENGNLSEYKPGECHHELVIERKDPTCMEHGIEREYCVNCGEIRYEAHIPPIPHYVGADGYCTMCGGFYGGGIDCNHNFVAEYMQMPTCTEHGYMREYCIFCGITNKEWSVEPLGHVP